MDLAAAFDDELSDPNSDLNVMKLLNDRCCDALGRMDDETRQIVGSALLRSYWLGEGRGADFVLSDPPEELQTVVPMPGVEPADNVVVLDMVTRIDIPAERVLNGALKANLESAFVLGYERDGELYTASSVAAGPELLWMLKLAEKRLLAIGDGDVPIQHLPGA